MWHDAHMCCVHGPAHLQHVVRVYLLALLLALAHATQPACAAQVHVARHKADAQALAAGQLLHSTARHELRHVAASLAVRDRME